MLMCATCKELYPDGDGLAFCPRPTEPGSVYTCGGKLQKIERLLCEDRGTVEICGETKSCPRGCHGKGAQ